MPQSDVCRVVRSLPKPVAQMMIDTGATLSGGYVRDIIAGVKPKDIDFHGKSAESMIAASAYLREAIGVQAKVIVTTNAITVSAPDMLDVQFITRCVADSMPELVGKFDFTVVQAAIVSQDDDWHGWVSDGFYRDLAGRRLVYTDPPEKDENAGGSAMRMVRFLRRGYDIDRAEFAKVMGRFAEMALSDHDVLPGYAADAMLAKLADAYGEPIVN